LYNNVPQTTENFRSLCVSDKHLCYVGNKLTHIFPQYLIRGNDFINIFSLLLLLLFNLIGGDIANFDGSGGECIYGKTFADENFNNKHSKPGIYQ
ncbi:unnamed protein product, partial [Rotaria magnacalcarata]